MAHDGDMGITRITAGVDPSPSAENALSWAARFSKAIGADLRAFTAWQMPLVAGMPEMVGSLPTDSYMEQQSKEMLDKITERVGVSERVDKVVVVGPAGPALASETGDDVLLVVGRHGSGQRHGLARVVEFMLGSAARHLVHHANGPVAILPTDADWNDAPKVLVGVDGSEASLEALRWVIDELPAASRIIALRTFIPTTSDPLTPVDLQYTPELIASIERELQDWVNDTIAGSTRRDAAVEPVVEIAAARFALTNPESGADIVVVGHRGRSEFTARLLGSVSDHVVRHAEIPVIVITGED